MRHPLARALHGIGMDMTDVAARLEVDPKTVARWIDGRVPYPRHRAALVRLTGWTERDLWPAAAPPEPTDVASEVRVTYPHRSSVPADVWHRFFTRADAEIGVLAYSALFLAEDAAVLALLRKKAEAGTRVRLLLGDPDGIFVAARGAEEGVGDLMTARIHNALLLFRHRTTFNPVDIRLHDTTLYASIFRADDELMINPHVYGKPASHAAVLHLRRRPSGEGMAQTYLESFERIWREARRLT
ncbi:MULTISPECIES: XRE family transcriptional regulator [Catenuloplanes]|uniref:DNA-binding transcriptional regulator YdaS (Cro superfamily) n=1 Tax=Catenuloplanes niger TaxID=587534 RepID=A0AAE4CV54_9ACTN|nr:XRE family transcriptional regulator [Catenuloplanes niger]MDR7322439.1 DNA-binding transcriptional regulator YdaS (Cro superfamily) [Catenuloplanes niger]